MSLQNTDTTGKRLELLRDVVPSLRRLAIIFNADYPSTVRETGEVQAVARTLGLEVAPHEIRRAEDIAPVFETLNPKRTQFTSWVTLSFSPTERRSSRLRSARGCRRSSITALMSARGALMSYGANFPALFQRAAEYVDKILRGAKPRDLPVEQPTKFDLVGNLRPPRRLD